MWPVLSWLSRKSILWRAFAEVLHLREPFAVSHQPIILCHANQNLRPFKDYSGPGAKAEQPQTPIVWVQGLAFHGSAATGLEEGEICTVPCAQEGSRLQLSHDLP